MPKQRKPPSAARQQAQELAAIHAANHKSVRAAHARETAEDYVQAVDDLIARTGRCRVVDLAARFGVSHVTVVRIVDRLQNEGFLETQPYRPVELSPAGKRLARTMKERRAAIHDALIAIGVGPKSAAADAEGMEHHVSRETLRCLKHFLRDQPASR